GRHGSVLSGEQYGDAATKATVEARPSAVQAEPRAPWALRGTVTDMRVAYQGDPGAFSEEGVRLLFPSAEAVPRRTLRHVFEAVGAGDAECGLVPVENSQAGSI